MTYSPKYISLDDIPVQIPDDYSDQEKYEALELAESSLEADINGGNAIPQSELTPLMEAALKQKGTCELAKGSEHPDDVALSDLDDTGSTKIDYANEGFCDEYENIVDKILATDTWSDTGTSTDPYVYSTKKPVDER